MSTADLLGTADPVGEKPHTENKLFRIAGLGAAAAIVAWVGQPIMVTLAARKEGGGEVTDWAGVESAKWSGAVEVVIFSGMGLLRARNVAAAAAAPRRSLDRRTGRHDRWRSGCAGMVSHRS
jgi:hypothetical protein